MHRYITNPKEPKRGRRDEIWYSDTRTSLSIPGRWVFIVHRSTVTNTSRSLVCIFLKTRMYLVHQLPNTQLNIYDPCSTRSVLLRWVSHSPPGILVNNAELQCRFHFVHFYMRLFVAHAKIFPLHTIHSVVIRIYFDVLRICWKRLENKTRTTITKYEKRKKTNKTQQLDVYY